MFISTDNRVNPCLNLISFKKVSFLYLLLIYKVKDRFIISKKERNLKKQLFIVTLLAGLCYYHEHPLYFNITAGIRFNWNK